ncbi:hypothetical protein GW17_00043362 [Ensete ventricosum]|nr:hypothetical protein GW17_00043362 [Ensete ventricosum]
MYVPKPKDTDKLKHFIKYLVCILTVTPRGEKNRPRAATAHGRSAGGDGVRAACGRGRLEVPSLSLLLLLSSFPLLLLLLLLPFSISPQSTADGRLLAVPPGLHTGQLSDRYIPGGTGPYRSVLRCDKMAPCSLVGRRSVASSSFAGTRRCLVFLLEGEARTRFSVLSCTGLTGYRYADRPLPGGVVGTGVSPRRNEVMPRHLARDEVTQDEPTQDEAPPRLPAGEPPRSLALPGLQVLPFLLLFFSLIFFFPPSVDTAQNRSSTVEIDHYRPIEAARWSKSIVTDRFWVVMGWKQPQSAVPPGSGRFAYRSAGRPVHAVLRVLSVSSGHATLRHLDINPHVPDVLAAILSYVGTARDILPLLEEPDIGTRTARYRVVPCISSRGNKATPRLPAQEQGNEATSRLPARGDEASPHLQAGERGDVSSSRARTRRCLIF